MERFDENKYWLGHIEFADDPRQARIAGKLYYIKPEDDPVFMRGMRGTPHVIEFKDGRLVRTTNLWICGRIPEAYREQLPDNAHFREVDREAAELYRAFRKRPYYKPRRKWR